MKRNAIITARLVVFVLFGVVWPLWFWMMLLTWLGSLL